MKKEFLEYLESIGITEPLRQRVETIHGFYREFCPEDIEDIFISEYVKKDGEREYESLWFFSMTYYMEAKQFLTQDDFDLVPMQEHIIYARIDKKDYDFKKATEKSRMSLLLGTDVDVGATLKASGENCDHLNNVIAKYVKPYLSR